MPYAVTLRLDEAAAAEVRRLWALVAAGDAAEYAPHVTLAVYPDDGDVGLLRDAVAVLAARWRALEVTFAGIGVFAGAVVWLAPVVTGELLRRHAELVGALPVAHPHYRVGAWVPHVTLAQELTEAGVAAAMSALLAEWRPFAGSLDRVEIVRFTPVEVLASWPLD